MWYTRNIFLLASNILFINWTVRMSDNLPERVQILGHVHIICITVWENRIIFCQIFCDLLLKTAFEWIFNVMQLILFKIKWHIKWKYLIKKFHDICLSYYFKFIFLLSTCRCIPQFSFSCLYFVKNGVGGCLFFLLFFYFLQFIHYLISISNLFFFLSFHFIYKMFSEISKSNQMKITVISELILTF